MNADDLRLIFDYNYWATARILRAATQLTAAQFTAANSSSYGSLRGTLVHALVAETVWRRRLEGDPQPVGLPVETDFPTPAALAAAWQAEETLLRAYLAQLTDQTAQTVIDYNNSQGVPYHNTVWKLLAHLANHGTQHRAEAAAMLTDFQHSPGDVDLILYFREKGLE